MPTSAKKFRSRIYHRSLQQVSLEHWLTPFLSLHNQFYERLGDSYWKGISSTAKMGGLRLKPARVYQTASLLLESQSISQPPPWYSTIGLIPPSEILTRPQPVQHRDVTPKKRTKKPSKMFKPQAIIYEEDRLRREFYKDHPWELARPRVVLEQDGRDGQKCDWSQIRQKHRPLTGERSDILLCVYLDMGTYLRVVSFSVNYGLCTMSRT